jgi:hypothetical protein
MFCLGLMAKPMLVTLPFLLLALDYWPLRRFQKRGGEEGVASHAQLILEKVPFLFLSLAAGVATLVAQKSTVGYGEQTPLLWRLGNASIAAIAYIGQMFGPRDWRFFMDGLRMAGPSPRSSSVSPCSF